MRCELSDILKVEASGEQPVKYPYDPNQIKPWEMPDYEEERPEERERPYIEIPMMPGDPYEEEQPDQERGVVIISYDSRSFLETL